MVFILEVCLLLGHCYGLTQDCCAVTLQQGKKAKLTFNLSHDVCGLLCNFVIRRFDFHHKYKDSPLDCFWIKESNSLECQILQRFFMDEIVTSQIHLNINQTSEHDAGIYECIVVWDGHEMVDYRLNVTVQGPTGLTFESSTENGSQSTSTNFSSSFKDVYGQDYEYYIPILIGVFVLLAAMVFILKTCCPKMSPQCKCHHSESDESGEAEVQMTEI